MKPLKKSLFLSVLLLLLVSLMMVTPAQAHRRGSVSVFVWGGWPWYWNAPYYDPYWYHPGYYASPYASPYAYPYPESYNYAPTIGYIKTDVEPEEAEVYLDDKKVGIADNYDGWPGYLKVTPGIHHLAFKLKGYEDLVLDVDAAAGRIYRVDYKMFKTGEAPPAAKESKESKAPAATGGTLRLKLTPPDAMVLIDGAPATAPADGALELKNLTPGKHKVEVNKEGYKPFSFEVTVEDGSDHSLGVALKQIEAEKTK